MLPLPAATTTLSNIQVTSQPVFNSFIPYGYMEIGLTIGALVVLFIIVMFWRAIMSLPMHLRAMFAHNTVRKFDTPAMHRDPTASSAAISEHRRFKKIMSGGNRVSRYD